ncbi:MAG: hypothetical protein VW378_02645 [bacterium]
MKRISFLIGGILIGCSVLTARPISYPGAWTIMQMNQWDKSWIHVHYSPNIKNSLGLNIDDYHNEGRININVKWNHLLKRRNTRFSQANLYLKSQIGAAQYEDKDNLTMSMAIAGDWETRRYFVAYTGMGEYTKNIDKGSFHQNARVGIAPYVAEYGSLHSWIMLQVEHHPSENQRKQQLIITPLLRFLKGVCLLEIGINSNGKGMLNWVIRF